MANLRKECERAFSLLHTHEDGEHEPNYLTENVGKALAIIRAALDEPQATPPHIPDAKVLAGMGRDQLLALVEAWDEAMKRIAELEAEVERLTDAVVRLEGYCLGHKERNAVLAAALVDCYKTLPPDRVRILLPETIEEIRKAEEGEL
jgi:hypothetical protein